MEVRWAGHAARLEGTINDNTLVESEQKRPLGKTKYS
jgi:hypothetical protein